MEHVPAEGAVGMVKMVLSVELIQAPPAELVLTVFAFHVLATTSVDNDHFALGTRLSTGDFVHVYKRLKLINVRHPIGYGKAVRLYLSCCFPSSVALCTRK